MDMTTTHETPGASVRIRSAVAADYPAIERLLTANKLPLDGVLDSLDGFMVADAETDIVGVIGMEYCGDYGLLRSVAVDADWRGHRIGRQMVERMLAEAGARGLYALYLLTTTAEQYFPSFGFSTIARDAVPAPIRATSEFQGACPASATVMALPLYRTPGAP
jgi:N-acetylglutamate synthase-like GNAT family acetyltransferase